ncbi:Type I phosphodiesterase / nucleotide pyrophosphatase [Caloramator fervidus]|uniref:Type I phosphodiesterase / nucleotide pyrophosphatase n=1 Tax=Caloramator fervidus TaxID=29344 RepID=A0A1H5SV42_9CLOT|nr:alkaline phosphatase family protein [Caloramator fervidus]SEF54436.1 Type I phosphodiesterase / nucleotide pyrophosphatase [Caloramator fervidus]
MKILAQIFIFIFLFLTSYNMFLNFQLSKFTFIDNQKNNKKVCIILIDGLRLDAIKYMPFIKKQINEKKALFYKSSCFIPSLSRPGYVRIFSGSSTKINGVSKNFYPIPSTIPDIFLLSRKKGLKTALCGYYWIYELYPFSFNYKYIYFNDDSNIFTKALNIIDKHKPDLILIHPMKVDKAGHKYGGISLNYKKACIEIDNDIQKLYEKIKNYTIIITSDHGHKDKGGHGDDNLKCLEIPIIFLGNLKDIKFYEKVSTTQLDISPTICDILNLPKTPYMEGKSLVICNNMTFQNKKFKNINKVPVALILISSYVSYLATKIIFRK